MVILDGASYELEHAKLPNRKDKKHASDLSPYLVELIAFEPMDGPNNCYGQLYKPISSTALNEDGKTYDEASVHGFTPLSPYRHKMSVVRLISLFLKGVFVGLCYWI